MNYEKPIYPVNYSWTSSKRPHKMSSQGARLWEVIAYEILDYIDSKFYVIGI